MGCRLGLVSTRRGLVSGKSAAPVEARAERCGRRLRSDLPPVGTRARPSSGHGTRRSSAVVDWTRPSSTSTPSCRMPAGRAPGYCCGPGSMRPEAIPPVHARDALAALTEIDQRLSPAPSSPLLALSSSRLQGDSPNPFLIADKAQALALLGHHAQGATPCGNRPFSWYSRVETVGLRLCLASRVASAPGASSQCKSKPSRGRQGVSGRLGNNMFVSRVSCWPRLLGCGAK